MSVANIIINIFQQDSSIK